MKRLFIGFMLLLLAAGAWAQDYHYEAMLAAKGITSEGMALWEQLMERLDKAKTEVDKAKKEAEVEEVLSIMKANAQLTVDMSSLEGSREKALVYLTRAQEQVVKEARRTLVDRLPEGTLWMVAASEWVVTAGYEIQYIVFFLKLNGNESSWMIDNRLN